MASALQKLLRRSHIGRAISTLQSPAPPHQFPALHILDPSTTAQPGHLGRFFGPAPPAESPPKPLPPPIFPSYRLGLFAEPVYLNLPDEGGGADDAESEESDGAMRADSVKKKRKKKMNKHKYKKLRKRLRRQT